MACGGKDPLKLKAVLDKIVAFVTSNHEKIEIFIHTKEIKGEVELIITFKLRAISDTNANIIETLKRDIEGLKKSGKRGKKEKISTENLVTDVVEKGSNRSELLSREDSAAQEIRSEAPKLEKFMEDKKKSERISVQDESAVREIMSDEQDVPKLAGVAMSDKQGSSNELKTVAEISLEQREEIIDPSNIKPDHLTDDSEWEDSEWEDFEEEDFEEEDFEEENAGEENAGEENAGEENAGEENAGEESAREESAREKVNAMVFIDCLIEFAMSKYGHNWKSKDSAEKLPEESFDKRFTKVIGETVIDIIYTNIDMYTYSYKKLRERSVNTSDSFMEECAYMAATSFREGYDHKRFLEYAANLVAYSIFYFTNDDHSIADVTAKVLSNILIDYIDNKSFSPIKDWFDLTLEAQHMRKEMKVDAKWNTDAGNSDAGNADV